MPVKRRKNEPIMKERVAEFILLINFRGVISKPDLEPSQWNNVPVSEVCELGITPSLARYRALTVVGQYSPNFVLTKKKPNIKQG